MLGLARCHNIGDLRLLARKRLPGPVADYLDGGADDEVALRRNRAAFDAVGLVPRYGVDVERVDCSTTVLGQRVSMPLALAPAALHKVFHPDGELGVARAAVAAGAMQFLSAMASTSLEDVAAVGAGPRCFQIYPRRDRTGMRDLLHRVRTAGYPAICVSIDVPAGGNRERDRKAGVAMPPRLTPAGWFAVAMHPRWTIGLLRSGRIGMPNMFADRARAVTNADVTFDPGVTWRDLEWLLSEWNGPAAIKGVLCVADARCAADAGASAVVLSNHGGRQLDSTIAPLEALPAVADAVGDRVEILLDSGVRRGTDVLKAIALGARACLVGRPYLYGLAAAGSTGVRHALSIFHDEIRRGLTLLGCPTPAHITRAHARRALFEEYVS
jgi:L-lactate dehydrogenase (cytochrome)